MTEHALLRTALRLNAGFSTTSALILFIAHRSLAEWMGIPTSLLLATGVGLIAFAAQLLVTSRRTDVARLRQEGMQSSLADFAWVVGTAVVVALGWVTPTGNLILVAVAIPVLALGIAQWRGLPSAEAASAGASCAAPRGVG